MKTRPPYLPIAFAILALAAARPPLAAAEAPAARSPEDLKEMAAVEQFLDLSDAELDQLQTVIARIRAMTPAQRAELREEIVRYRRLTEPQREQMRQGWSRAHPGLGPGSGWGQMTPEIRAGWREMMHAATAEQQAAILARLQALPPGQRVEYRRQLVEDYLKGKAAKP